MERNNIPDGRLQRYALAAAEESRIVDQQRVANQALQDIPRLPRAGEVDLAGGAVMMALRAILLRAAVPADSEGVAAERRLVAKSRSAAALGDLDTSAATVMVQAAAAPEAVILAEGHTSPGQRGRS